MNRVVIIFTLIGIGKLLLATERISLREPLVTPYEIQPQIAPRNLNLRVVNPQEPVKGWPVDTLENDDGRPVWYFSPPTLFMMARLSPSAPCTLRTLMLAKQRGLSRDTIYPVVAGCSLLVCKDTLIGGFHYPGRRLITGYARDSLPRGWFAAWFTYNLYPNYIFRLSAEDFWVGFRYLRINNTDTLYQLGDTLASASDRNAYASVSTGPWYLFDGSDFMNRAIVKYEAVDVHDISVLGVGNSQGFFLPNPGNATLSGLIKNTGNVPENNFPVVCTVYTETGNPVANWSFQVTTQLGVNEERTITFTPNWQPTTNGVYHITVRAKLPNDARPSNDRQIREAQVSTYPAELRYDDGERDNAWAWYRRGNGWANKFTPPYYPTYITGVRYCTWSDSWPVPGGTRMLAQILDDDGPQGLPGTILWQETVQAVRGTFNNVSVPNIPITSGAFYVAYIQTDTWIYSPGLAIDEDPPYAFPTYAFFNGVWSYDSTYGGDWMIRVLTSGPPDVGCTRIEVPIGTVDSGGVITPACSVYNYGTIVASYPVRMKIGNFYNLTANITNHPPGTYRYVTFPNWNINQPRGSYAVVCSTELAGDGNNSNDRRTGQVFIRILDVGAVAIVYPQDSVKIDSSFTPQARARNYGNTPVSFPTTFSIIRGTETLYQKVVNITLNPDSIRTIAFPETAFGIVGWYRTLFRTNLSGDMNPGNDLVRDSFKVYEPLVGIESEATERTQRIGLQIPSNPIGKLTTIRYSLPKKEKAVLKVYNLFGELCYSAESDKGFFSLKLPAGIYLLRLETKDYKEERKLILVK